MGTFAEWADANPTKTGEPPTERMCRWIAETQKKLLKAFPKGERAFCRIIDLMKSKLPRRWMGRLHYTRQKVFMVASEVVFFGDFYFKNVRLLVEIDGATHLGDEAREKDAWRASLVSLFRRTTVLRFTNDQVLHGDFRLVEQTFIEAASASLPRAVGGKLLRDHQAAKKRNPAIYQVEGIVTTYRD